jgi:ATP-binding cassette subfamily F protein uup
LSRKLRSWLTRNTVVTSTIAWEGPGQWREYEGGVQDWLDQSRRSRDLAEAGQPKAAKEEARPVTARSDGKPKRKLSYKEQRELDLLPERIAALEAEQKSIQAALADGSLYASDNARAVQLHQRDGEIDDQLMEALERWSALSE